MLPLASTSLWKRGGTSPLASMSSHSFRPDHSSSSFLTPGVLASVAFHCSAEARFVWVCSAAGKARLAALAAEANRGKILSAPVTVIIGHDLAFADRLEQLNPGRGEGMKPWFADPAAAETSAFRNGSLQGAFMMLAARALGLDCGPMSGFDNAAVDAAFFAGTRIRANFICGLGYGSDERLFPRLPRLSFDEAGWLV